VFNGDHYVIASVVIGEAIGNTANYAYILSGAKSEGRDADDNYYWEFEAVLNGEIKTLTIKSKWNNTVDYLTPGQVQSLRFDGDYVVDIKDVDNNKIVTAATTQIDEKVHEVYDVYAPSNISKKSDGYTPVDALPDSSTAVSEAVDLFLSGRTLYTGVTGDKGLTFAREAKAVLIQTENNKTVKREYSSVAEAVGALADAKTDNASDGLQFRGRIVAILNSYGVADSVVILSGTPVESGKTPDYGTSTTGQLALTGLGFDGTNATIYFQSKVALNTGDTTVVTVRNEKGVIVAANASTVDANVLVNGFGTTKIPYTGMNSETAEYTVTLEITSGTNVYSVSGVVGVN